MGEEGGSEDVGEEGGSEDVGEEGAVMMWERRRGGQ